MEWTMALMTAAVCSKACFKKHIIIIIIIITNKQNTSV